ncbi:MAG: hypothetical protein ACRDTD_07555 [Pseudonocardiaceae bacterium]
MSAVRGHTNLLLGDPANCSDVERSHLEAGCDVPRHDVVRLTLREELAQPHAIADEVFPGLVEVPALAVGQARSGVE